MNTEKLKKEIERLTMKWASIPAEDNRPIAFEAQRLLMDKIERLREYLEYSN